MCLIYYIGCAHGVIVVHGASKFRSRSERLSNFRVKSLLKAFCQFGTAGTRSANHTIDSPSLFQLRHPDTSRIHYIKTLQILWLTKYALYNRSKTMKLLTYNTLLCTPILEYTLEFWDHSSKQLESLVEVVQHKAVKLLSRNLKEIFRLLKI